MTTVTATATATPEASMIATFTFDSAKFRQALAWVAPSAGKPGIGTPDCLTGIQALVTATTPHHFGTNWKARLPIMPGPVLTLVATDRYRLSWASLPATHAEADEAAPVVLLGLDKALKSFPKTVGSIIRLRLGAGFAEVASLDGTSTASTTLDSPGGDFPKWQSLVPTAFDEDDSPAALFTADTLGAAMKAASAAARKSEVRIRLRGSGAVSKAACLGVVPKDGFDDVYMSGLVMPCRER